MNYWVFPKMQMIGKYGRLLKDWPSQCTLTKIRFVCVQSINLFRFPSIHLQGLNHMDIEIVKNTSLTVKYSKSQC